MLRTITTILWKDLRIELRTRDALSASFVFCVLVLVVFNFTLDLDSEEARRLGAGFLWVAFAFSGILSLNRTFSLEKADGCSKSLMLAPVGDFYMWSVDFFDHPILGLDFSAARPYTLNFFYLGQLRQRSD